MITTVTIPQLDANILEVTIIEWRRREGEAVAVGEPLVEVSTEKANFEIEAPAAGVLRRIVAAEKSVLPTEYVIALIGPPEEPLPDVEPANRARLAAFRQSRGEASAPSAAPAPAQPAVAADRNAPVRATPVARRLAREWGLDLAALRDQTGDAVITEELVRQHAGRPTP